MTEMEYSISKNEEGSRIDNTLFVMWVVRNLEYKTAIPTRNQKYIQDGNWVILP